jgi:multiple sugar transport system ATP-binding protein
VATIELESVTCFAGCDRVLDAVDLAIRDAELMALIGPSGSGKTSILRVIAGLDTVTSGRVLFDDVDMTSASTRERDVAMVFQPNTLFRAHTVRRNVGFPLWIRRRSRREIDQRVTAEARALDIEGVLDRWPDELSDGHQRLVQIARAMIRTPRVFLLDEPLARLDPPTRIKLRRELRTLQSGYGVAMVYATSNPEEALALGDRVAVVEGGRIVQVDEPRTLWHHPTNRSTAELTGPMAFIDVSVDRDGHGYTVSAPGLRLRAWTPALGDLPHGRAVVGVRPEDIRLADLGPITATLGRVVFDGAHRGREVVVGNSRLASRLEDTREDGTEVSIAFERWHMFHPSGSTICTVG